MGGARENNQYEERKKQKVIEDESVFKCRSACEDIPLTVGGNEYSVRMDEKGSLQCPFCEKEITQVKNHLNSCVKTTHGKSATIQPDFFVKVEAEKKRIRQENKKKYKQERRENKTVQEKTKRLKEQKHYNDEKKHHKVKWNYQS